jgi:signal peptidase I
VSSVLRVLAWLTVIGGALAAIGYYTYADVWTVPTDDPRLLVSIEPTLRGGDVVLTSRHSVPVLGNLVRCVDPDEPRRWVVGRLIGVSGAELKVTDQFFSLTGSREAADTACDSQKLINPGSGDEVELSCRNNELGGLAYQTLAKMDGTQNDRPIQLRVPAGKSYIYSDNRYLHLDSRDFGSVPDTSCQHIFFRLWGAAGFSDGARRFTILW